MIGVIPNPKKIIQTNHSVEDIKVVLSMLTTFTNKYKFTKSLNELNQFIFERYETFSFGVFIDISIFFIQENISNIEIEIRRKIGSFDKSSEVTYANDHILSITETINKALEFGVEKIIIKKQEFELEQKKIKEIKEAKEKETQIAKEKKAEYKKTHSNNNFLNKLFR